MKRSLSLDIFKIVLSILIIAVHIQPLFETRNLTEWLIGAGLSRLPVPIFFIINGYFLANKIEDGKNIRKYLSHLVVVYIVWSIFYLFSYHEGTALSTIISQFILGYHHLWYLPALMAGVGILFFARKYIKNDLYLFAFIFILFMVANIDEVSKILPNLVFQHQFGDNSIISLNMYRNGLFMAFPFITLGYLIKKWNIQDYFKSWHLAFISAVSLLCLLIEAYNGYENRIIRELYLSVFIFGPAIIALLLKNPYTINKSLFTEYLGYLPNGIYYIHVFFIYKFYSIDNNIYNIPVVFIVSVLTTIVLVFINRRIRIFL